jgi:hypothetical protein
MKRVSGAYVMYAAGFTVAQVAGDSDLYLAAYDDTRSLGRLFANDGGLSSCDPGDGAGVTFATRHA